LNCLNKMEDEDPRDWSLHSCESYVDVQHLMSALEVANLKKKFASLKRLECKLQENMSYQKTHIPLGRLFKKFWIYNKMNTYTIIFLKRKERVVRAKMNYRRKKRKWKALQMLHDLGVF